MYPVTWSIGLKLNRLKYPGPVAKACDDSFPKTMVTGRVKSLPILLIVKKHCLTGRNIKYTEIYRLFEKFKNSSPLINKLQIECTTERSNICKTN